MTQNYWIEAFKKSLDNAIEIYHRGQEGDHRNALIMVDNAIETLMRHFIAFEKNKDPERYFDKLIKQLETEGVSNPLLSEIIYYHGIRNGLYHSDFKSLIETMKRPVDLTIEKRVVKKQIIQAIKLLKEISGKYLGEIK